MKPKTNPKKEKNIMYKKIVSIITVLLLSTVNFVGCAAEETTTQTSENIEIILQIGNPVMTVNGTEKEIDPGMGTAPVVINDRTLLPVRAVVEEMGGTAGWNGDTQEVTLSYNNDEIKLTIDSSQRKNHRLDGSYARSGSRCLYRCRSRYDTCRSISALLQIYLPLRS